LKNRGVSLFLPFYTSRLIGGRDRMNSSGLECEGYLVHFKGIKGESE